MLAYAGLRWGEVGALRVYRVDLLRRRIEVDEANTEVNGYMKPDDLVFTSPTGGVLRNTSSRPPFFDPPAERVGLVGLTPHELIRSARPSTTSSTFQRVLIGTSSSRSSSSGAAGNGQGPLRRQLLHPRGREIDGACGKLAAPDT